MDVEFEHGAHDPQTDVTHDDPILTGKIALAHLKEFADYYVRLARIEAEAEGERAARGRGRAAPEAPGRRLPRPRRPGAATAGPQGRGSPGARAPRGRLSAAGARRPRRCR
jgi:hypothetical protein